MCQTWKILIQCFLTRRSHFFTVEAYISLWSSCSWFRIIALMPNRRSRSPTQMEHLEFQDTVHQICSSNGFDSNKILSRLKRYSPNDFLCGPEYLRKPDQIPTKIWSKLCEHFHAAVYRPYHRQMSNPITNIVHHKQKPEIFIPNKVTERIIRSKLISENISTARRLYQYLNWTMRISKMAQTNVVMEGRSGRRLLLINVELHDQRGQELYAICIPNDMVTPDAPSWKLRYLLTGNELTNLLGVGHKTLPRGVRAVSTQFENYRKMGYGATVCPDSMALSVLKAEICKTDSRRKPIRYAHLKCVRTGNGKKRRIRKSQKKHRKSEEKVFRVVLSELHEAVRRALRDDAVELVPIVTILSTLDKQRGVKIEDFRYEQCVTVYVSALKYIADQSRTLFWKLSSGLLFSEHVLSLFF